MQLNIIKKSFGEQFIFYVGMLVDHSAQLAIKDKNFVCQSDSFDVHLYYIWHTQQVHMYKQGTNHSTCKVYIKIDIKRTEPLMHK